MAKSDHEERDPTTPNMQRSVLVLVLALTVVVCLGIMLFQNPPAADSAAARAIQAPRDRFAELMSDGRDTYASTGDYKKAESLFREASAINPNSAAAVDAIGQMALLDKRYEDARKLFQRANALSPEQPEYEADLAISLLCLDRLEEADKVVEQADRRFGSPRHKFALIRACILQKQNQPEKAEANLLEAYDLIGDKVIPIVNINHWAEPIRKSEAFSRLERQRSLPTYQTEQ